MSFAMRGMADAFWSVQRELHLEGDCVFDAAEASFSADLIQSGAEKQVT